MAIPITCSEKWNYQVQNQIFSKLYRDTAKTEWIKGPAFIAFGASTTIRIVALTASIGELTFKGLRLVVSSNPSSEQSLRGRVLLKKVPLKVAWDLIGASLSMLIINSIRVTFDTEYYILSRAEHSKVDWDHAEKGTIGSEDYRYDSDDATGRAKTGREKWKNQLENNT